MITPVGGSMAESMQRALYGLGDIGTGLNDAKKLKSQLALQDAQTQGIGLENAGRVTDNATKAQGLKSLLAENQLKSNLAGLQDTRATLEQLAPKDPLNGASGPLQVGQERTPGLLSEQGKSQLAGNEDQQYALIAKLNAMNGKHDLATPQAVKADYEARKAKDQASPTIIAQNLERGGIDNKQAAFTLGQDQAMAPSRLAEAKNTAKASDTKPAQAQAQLGLTQAEAEKARADANKTKNPVKWTDKVDDQGYIIQTNPVTGETRNLGVKAQAKPGSVTASKDEIQSIKEQSIKQIDELLKHPGFSDAVGRKGISQGFGLMSTPIAGTDAADFIARLEQVQGGSFMQARQMLKGGGAITDFEGKKAESAMTRMRTSTSEKEFQLAAKDYKDALEEGIKKLSDSGIASGGHGQQTSQPKFKILSVE